MPTTYIDFEEVKATADIIQVAERLGLQLKKSGHQYRGPCFSGADGDRKLVITPAKRAWYSFALNKGGDVIALVSEVNQCGAKEAAQFIMGDTVPEKRERSKRTSSPQGAARGFRALDYLEPDHEAVAALGFDAETAHQLQLGFAPRGILKGTVAIPLRNQDGSIAGYIGVCEIEKLPPKWELV